MKNYWLEKHDIRCFRRNLCYPHIYGFKVPEKHMLKMSVLPVIQTPVALDPDTFIPRKGILTRYGKKLLQEGAKFYGKINLQ